MKGRSTNYYRSKVSKSEPSTPHPIHSTSWPHTQIAAELSHHAVWVRGGDLGQACQNENVTVFERSLVHGLKNQRELCLVIQKEMISISSKGKREYSHCSVIKSLSCPLISSNEVCP